MSRVPPFSRWGWLDRRTVPRKLATAARWRLRRALAGGPSAARQHAVRRQPAEDRGRARDRPRAGGAHRLPADLGTRPRRDALRPRHVLALRDARRRPFCTSRRSSKRCSPSATASACYSDGRLVGITAARDVDIVRIGLLMAGSRSDRDGSGRVTRPPPSAACHASRTCTLARLRSPVAASCALRSRGLVARRHRRAHRAVAARTR